MNIYSVSDLSRWIIEKMHFVFGEVWRQIYFCWCLVTTNLSRICQMVAKGLASRLPFPEKTENGVVQTEAVAAWLSPVRQLLGSWWEIGGTFDGNGDWGTLSRKLVVWWGFWKDERLYRTFYVDILGVNSYTFSRFHNNVDPKENLTRPSKTGDSSGKPSGTDPESTCRFTDWEFAIQT